MEDLASRKCAPCRGGVAPLSGEEIRPLAEQLRGWEVSEGRRLTKSYEFKNFQEALDFVNRVGRLAEDEGHHPDVCFGWGRAELTVWTHDIGGLSENDFILAAKIDRLGAA